MIGVPPDAVDEPSNWKFATQACISWQTGQSCPPQSWSASTVTKTLEKAMVASTNAAQSPDRTRRVCVFGRKTLRNSENIAAGTIAKTDLI